MTLIIPRRDRLYDGEEMMDGGAEGSEARVVRLILRRNRAE